MAHHQLWGIVTFTVVSLVRNFPKYIETNPNSELADELFFIIGIEFTGYGQRFEHR
jgi:hypothetical protein